MTLSPPAPVPVPGSVQLGDPQQLVELEAFSLVTAAADLWADHRPDPVICDGVGFHTESDYLEVETGLCNYASAEAPSLVPVAVGDEVELLVWHNDLASLDPTEGHVALSLDGAIVWELTVPIPGGADIYAPVLTSTIAADAGAQVGFHVHNHGANSWRMAAPTVRGQIVQ